MHDVSVHTRRCAGCPCWCGFGVGLLREYGQRARGDHGSVQLCSEPLRYDERTSHRPGRSNHAGYPDDAIRIAHHECPGHDRHTSRHHNGPGASLTNGGAIDLDDE